MPRLSPKVLVRISSPNKSSRHGVKPQLIVLHDTESNEHVRSASDLEAIGNYFHSSSAQVSAHVCTDGDGHSARYVRDYDKAWHCAGYNSLSLGIEQIGHATQTHWSEAQLRETARWVARWSIKHNIPIREGAVSGGRATKSGVVTHAQLGAIGGGHHDPGNNYPVKEVLDHARAYKKALLAR